MGFYGAEHNNIELGLASINIVVLCSIKPHIDLVQVQLLYNIHFILWLKYDDDDGKTCDY